MTCVTLFTYVKHRQKKLSYELKSVLMSLKFWKAAHMMAKFALIPLSPLEINLPLTVGLSFEVLILIFTTLSASAL